MSHFIIREVNQADVSFLWEMLYYAARMAEDGAENWEAAKSVPFLAQYVADWGKAGDFGLVAFDLNANQNVGAAWVRLLTNDKASVTYHDDQTPELAIAVTPTCVGNGIGTALLTKLIAEARHRYPALVLSVRADNPAFQLYQRMGFVVTSEIVNRVGTLSYKMLLKFE